jgi:hypothetical protein
MLNADPKNPHNRAIFIMVGTTFVGVGLIALRHSPIFSYQTWWGGMAFGSFAILFGLVFILGAIFKPDIFKP